MALSYNTTDGHSKTLVGNYVEERALLSDSGYTRGTHIHTKLETKSRIMGTYTDSDTQTHYVSTTKQSYTPDAVNIKSHAVLRAQLRDKQYENIVQNMLTQNAAQKQQEQEQQYKQWQYSQHNADNYDLKAKSMNKNTKLAEHIHQSIPNENVNNINTVGTNFYTEQLGRNKFNKNTAFSKPITEYNEPTKIL